MRKTKKLVFCGSFTSGGCETKIGNGRLDVIREGYIRKFTRELTQLSFCGPEAFKKGQSVLYVTERAVFRLTGQGLELVEIAPGVDMEKDILAQMEFAPKISPALRLMDEALFREEKVGIALTGSRVG